MSGEPAATTTRLFFREAIARALLEEMTSDDRVIVLGQDVGAFGGAYKEFRGLHGKFGSKRVIDTPVAEAAMVGVAIGAAATGLKPLVSITYMDFLMLALDPLINYGAKAKFKTAGQIVLPLVVKTTAGANGQGVAHSQCIESWLMNVPGLRVVAPSSPADAYGLMKGALHAGGPVVFIDHKRLFPISGEVSLEKTAIPLGKASVLKQGSDVTISTHGYMTRIAMEAATRLEREGISCAVIDLRTLSPLDTDTVTASVEKTRALVTLEEGQLICGVGSEVVFQVSQCLGPIKTARVGAMPAPVSSNTILESAVVPNADRLIAAIREILNT